MGGGWNNENAVCTRKLGYSTFKTKMEEIEEKEKTETNEDGKYETEWLKEDI